MQVCCSEQCSLVDACVLFAYTTFPVVLLSLLQWCGFDFKQRAQKTQATLSRRHMKQVWVYLFQTLNPQHMQLRLRLGSVLQAAMALTAPICSPHAQCNVNDTQYGAECRNLPCY